MRMNQLNRRKSLYTKVKDLNQNEFESIVEELYDYQLKYNELYSVFVRSISKGDVRFKGLDSLVFLPIQFFKQYPVQSGKFTPDVIYRSSGTSKSTKSQHFIKDASLYLDNAVRYFEKVYGSLKSFIFIGLLPGYVERNDASLIAMVKRFIDETQDANSGFYLDQISSLNDHLCDLQQYGKQVCLFGVSHALLQFSKMYSADLPLMVMETGGMKGMDVEWTKSVLHDHLKAGFKVDTIHSEYGMTELLSQAYATENGIFRMSDTLKIQIRELTDPLCVLADGNQGIINCIDIINIDSCAFIETEDLGVAFGETFELRGRMDHAEIRGCNLLISDI